MVGLKTLKSLFKAYGGGINLHKCLIIVLLKSSHGDKGIFRTGTVSFFKNNSYGNNTDLLYIINKKIEKKIHN